ncbi:hypothetical protein [Microbacterium allomyrinae]|uniref:Uncharacterized protein n=1 Tax=Microbacterium allomyrinae TaxID=2830666 RepID=A0A9X1LUT1_9MICO|nr:hypothetical protein [Microbacterium allomyrinae]MCC2032191.1 hypothetical protein [Microbacterium allomyrinae]
MTSRIRLDATKISVVVTCTDCPHWSAFRFTKRDAWQAARAHEKRAHPGATQATSNLAKHADTP